MFVIKRDGSQESMQFDKITVRLNALMTGLDAVHVVPEEITQKVTAGIKRGVCTREIDELAAETAAFMVSKHPDYAVLAARILVSSLHKETVSCFSEAMRLINETEGAVRSNRKFFSDEFMQRVAKHAKVLDAAIEHHRDFDYDYFGFKTLRHMYLHTSESGKVLERPQYLLMRVALALHLDNVSEAVATYKAMAARQYVHATPTLVNAGKDRGQLSSCFLLQIGEDSLSSIYDTLKQCATISQHAGGLGVAIHKIRSTGSLIRSSRGHSTGIVPMLRNFNSTVRYVDQGGRRKGAMSVYIEPWHADIFQFLDLRKNTGTEESRCRDLFTALWIPDLFMTRVDRDEDWSLFSEDTAPGLWQVYGDAFEALYTQYEREGRARAVWPARKVWYAILESQQQTGTPYMLYKDACNRANNQSNLGTLTGSNLCCEILEYTAPDEAAVCNLAAVNYAAFVRDAHTDHATYDFAALYQVAYRAAVNLDRVIDVTYYPIEEARRSNLRHRPVALGEMGLADAFQLMQLPFDSPEAQQLNRDLAETMYHACLQASANLAVKHGPYATFAGSPLSRGQFQFDLWHVTPSDRYDWNALRSQIQATGVRNSLSRASMPTATISQIVGQTESFEPRTSNLYVRRVLAGDFIVLNRYLAHDLQRIGLWTEDIIRSLVAARGSVQGIPAIPDRIKAVYRTVWEIPMRTQIDMAADRGAFVCQTQSFNVHMAHATAEKLTKLHFYAWRKGLKTGMYYLRTAPATEAIQFTVDHNFQIAPTAGASSATVVEVPSDTEASKKPPSAVAACTRESNCLACQ